MDVRPIDADWAAATFPAVFAVYGASPLRRQIEAFNEVVSATRFSHDDVEFAFAAMGRECRNIHRPLLNTLSLFPNPDWSPQGKAMLLLLESSLRQSLDVGDNQSTYRDMLLNPQSYMDLIAELDWASALRSHGGTFRPHSKTHPDLPDDNTNYDLNWEFRGPTFRGDVKWFKNWLGKPRGQDLLRGQIWSIKRDLAHHIIVKAPLCHWTPDDVLKAALEVLELYRAALEGRRDDRWVIAGNRKRIQIAVKRAFYVFPLPPDLRVESVTILLPETGHGSVSVVESGAGGDEDRESARRNVAGAASQVPLPAGGDDISCVCVGSSAPQDFHDVELALFGNPDGSGAPGMFDPKSTEPGYEHLNAAVHFCLAFEPAADNPKTVVIERSATLFRGPNALTAGQEAFLRAVLGVYHRASTVAVP